MNDPMREFNLDDALSNARITPDPEFKNTLRARLQSIRKTSQPALSTNGWRRPLSLLFEPTQQRPKEDMTMSNTRLIPAIAIGLALIMVIMLGVAVLLPGTMSVGRPFPTQESPSITESPESTVTPTPTETPTAQPTEEDNSRPNVFIAESLDDLAGVWYSRFNGRYLVMDFTTEGKVYQDWGAMLSGRVEASPPQDKPHSWEYDVWFEDGLLNVQQIVDPADPTLHALFKVGVRMGSDRPLSLTFIPANDEAELWNPWTQNLWSWNE